MKRFALKSLIDGFVLGILTTILVLLGYFNISQVIEILTSIYALIVGLSAIIAVLIGWAYNYIKKPKIKLVLENAQFVAKGFDHTSTFYQLKVKVINEGKRTCPNLNDVSISIKNANGESPNLIKVSKDVDDMRKFILHEEQMRNVGYCWVDKKRPYNRQFRWTKKR